METVYVLSVIDADTGQFSVWGVFASEHDARDAAYLMQAQYRVQKFQLII